VPSIWLTDHQARIGLGSVTSLHFSDEFLALVFSLKVIRYVKLPIHIVTIMTIYETICTASSTDLSVRLQAHVLSQAINLFSCAPIVALPDTVTNWQVGSRLWSILTI
jgi:hypothetical protein